MKYIFLDTNIFIHFQYYDQIDWKEIVKDEYRIIIASIVLDELDKHKTNSNKRIAKKVKAILSKIEKEQNNINNIIDICDIIPKDETFNKYRLSKNQQDHSLLASIIEFGEIHELKNTLLVSYDTGVRLRAKQLEINAIKLDDKYLLQDEDSEEDKELKKLRKENAELKNNLPDVILTFENEKLHKEFEIKPLTQSENEYCLKSLDIIKKGYPLFELEEVNFDNYFNQALNFNPFAPTIEQQREYNKSLEKFYLEYEQIFKSKYKWDKILSNAVKLDFYVLNKGTAPAEDIDIFLTFPDTVKLIYFENFPKYEKPEPPYKPKYAHDKDMSGIFNPPVKEYICYG